MNPTKVNEYLTLFDQIESCILRKVNNSTGLKAVELALAVLAEIAPKTYKNEEYGAILQTLVDRGEILELEYTVPHIDYKIKSIYFPKGTVISAKKL